MPEKHETAPDAATKQAPESVSKPVNMAPPPKPGRAEAAVQPTNLTLSKADVKSLESHSKVKHEVIEPAQHGRPVKLHVKVKSSSNTEARLESVGTQATSSDKRKQSLEIWGSSTPEEKMHKRESLQLGSEGVKYGPNGCVSVHKNPENHCIMSTSCAGSEMVNYEYGLVCVDKVGSPVKHLFGKDSFDPVESFDTLIQCNECLGLEDVPGGVALAGEVSVLAKAISGLKAAVTNISMKVWRLDAEVLRTTTPSSPAPALPTAAPIKFLHKSSAHHMHSKAKKHMRHVVESNRQAKKKKHLRHSHFRHHAYNVTRHAAVSEEDRDDADGID